MYKKLLNEMHKGEKYLDKIFGAKFYEVKII